MITSVTLAGLELTDPVIPTDDGYGLNSVDGWGSLASTISPTQRPRGHGAWAGDAFLQARSISLTGQAYFTAPAVGTALADALIAVATLDTTSLVVTESDLRREVRVRRDGDVVIKHTPVPHLFDWSVQLVAIDPRKLGSAVTGVTALPSVSGGMLLPTTVPFLLNSSVVSGSISLINPGTVAGPLRLRVDGPIQGPVITHVASGRSLVFASSLTLGVGEWLEIDVDARTVLANGQSSRAGWITSRQWPRFEPGANTFAFTAVAYSASARLTVEATPAWM